MPDNDDRDSRDKPPFRGFGPSLGNATVPPALHDEEQRHQCGLPRDRGEPGWYMLELNLQYTGGLIEAGKQFEALYAQVLGQDEARRRSPVLISKTYYRCLISVDEWRALLREDEKNADRARRVIYKIWPDFKIKPLVDRSVATVKADAAYRAYAATGSGICWAVIDSGIDARHVHFGGPGNPQVHTLTDPSVIDLHRDFTGPGPVSKDTAQAALTDRYGHGTHVAGIIAGGVSGVSPDRFRVFENVFVSDPDQGDGGKQKKLSERSIGDRDIRGVAPQCKLVSLKVLNDDGEGRASDIIRAMQYIREDVNHDPKLVRIHGVNLSIGYEFDAEMFACGQSPLCLEVDRLVKSGVTVVVAAGNTGYGKLSSDQRMTKVSLSNTINDPGNSVLAITVGATHRDSPHIYGVSYFSSRGPTGDGRMKPDLVAPGERITSCAAGKYLVSNDGDIPDDLPAYVDESGTSMSAPHGSGVIAAFLSIRREFIQHPEDVKRIFMDNATSLGRERYFEGRGLVDLMRAIQSV